MVLRALVIVAVISGTWLSAMGKRTTTRQDLLQVDVENQATDDVNQPARISPLPDGIHGRHATAQQDEVEKANPAYAEQQDNAAAMEDKDHSNPKSTSVDDDAKNQPRQSQAMEMKGLAQPSSWINRSMPAVVGMHSLGQNISQGNTKSKTGFDVPVNMLDELCQHLFVELKVEQGMPKRRASALYWQTDNRCDCAWAPSPKATDGEDEWNLFLGSIYENFDKPHGERGAMIEAPNLKVVFQFLNARPPAIDGEVLKCPPERPRCAPEEALVYSFGEGGDYFLRYEEFFGMMKELGVVPDASQPWSWTASHTEGGYIGWLDKPKVPSPWQVVWSNENNRYYFAYPTGDGQFKTQFELPPGSTWTNECSPL